jgi:hypothetical protein
MIKIVYFTMKNVFILKLIDKWIKYLMYYMKSINFQVFFYFYEIANIFGIK